MTETVTKTSSKRLGADRDEIAQPMLAVHSDDGVQALHMGHADNICALAGVGGRA